MHFERHFKTKKKKREEGNMNRRLIPIGISIPYVDIIIRAGFLAILKTRIFFRNEIFMG